MYEHLEVRQRLTAGWPILIALTDAFGDAITPSVTRAWKLLGFRGQQAGFPLSEDHADLATALRVKRYRWSAAIARRRAAFATGAGQAILSYDGHAMGQARGLWRRPVESAPIMGSPSCPHAPN
jgi:hypothetical protein